MTVDVSPVEIPRSELFKHPLLDQFNETSKTSFWFWDETKLASHLSQALSVKPDEKSVFELGFKHLLQLRRLDLEYQQMMSKFDASGRQIIDEKYQKTRQLLENSTAQSLENIRVGSISMILANDTGGSTEFIIGNPSTSKTEGKQMSYDLSSLAKSWRHTGDFNYPSALNTPSS